VIDGLDDIIASARAEKPHRLFRLPGRLVTRRWRRSEQGKFDVARMGGWTWPSPINFDAIDHHVRGEPAARLGVVAFDAAPVAADRAAAPPSP
jgi:hypothetical protein